MPSAYSYDLRRRVIQSIESGMSRLEVAKIFLIGTATIQRWWSRYKKSSNFSSKVGYQKGHSHKISDTKAFKKFIAENPSMTCEEAAEALGDMSGETVRATLKRLGYSRKKRIFVS